MCTDYRGVSPLPHLSFLRDLVKPPMGRPGWGGFHVEHVLGVGVGVGVGVVGLSRDLLVRCEVPGVWREVPCHPLPCPAPCPATPCPACGALRTVYTGLARYGVTEATLGVRRRPFPPHV